MHSESMKLMQKFKVEFADKIPSAEISVLDIGARRVHRAHNTYRRIFKPPRYVYTGMDIEPGLNVDIVGYENILRVYDIVISGQTLEHVKRPWEWMKLWAKYFLDYICVIAPHSAKEHRFPMDTYRYLPDGMADLFNYAGIIPVETIKDDWDTMGIGRHGSS